MKRKNGTVLLVIVAAVVVTVIGLFAWRYLASQYTGAENFLTAYFTLDGTDESLRTGMENPYSEENSAALFKTLYGPLAETMDEESMTAAISQRERLDLAAWAVKGGYVLTPKIDDLDAQEQSEGGTSIHFSLTATISDGQEVLASLQQTGELQTDADGWVTYIRPDDLEDILTWGD